MDTSIPTDTRIVGTHEDTGWARVSYLYNGAGTGIIIRTHGYPLTSAFAVDHVKIFIYVEAKTQNDINQVERLSAICLMQKFVHLKELDTKLR
jgi:hypothetical protein